jgi:glutamine synthetase adenylyltransferase
MTDSDVQDVREAIAKAREEDAQHQNLVDKMDRLSKTPGISKEDREVQIAVERRDAEEEEEKRNKEEGSG